MKEQQSRPLKNFSLGLTIAALGIVYGDIGTSPLYAVKECFYGTHAIAAAPANIFGVLSLIFWSLTIVISTKYILFIMRADNHGEGGIFALLALLPTADSIIRTKTRHIVVFFGLLGAALLSGDGLITPAISVLSAVEGLEVATDAASNFIVPITCGVLFALFLAQHRGTSGIGSVFGPVMLLWFFAISALGLLHIAGNPQILAAVNPIYAFRFFADNQLHGIVVLGSVVLCITGGEALYADMGHFGRGPIRISWFALVYPSLLLNYFGQGALLLEQPELAVNPFYGLIPKDLLYPMVALATLATVIASQAMISGAFSVVRQAIQLGYCPRLTIVHTSAHAEGQIYIPEVNWLMMIGCIALVLIFRSSSGLAGAYGVAVTADMGITSLLYFFIATKRWNWPVARTLPIVGLFLLFDMSYFGSNLLKFFDGGWLPLAVAAVLVSVMATWKDGRAELYRGLLREAVSFDVFLKDIAENGVHRIEGTIVFLASSFRFPPPSLVHYYKHNRTLHEKVILLTITSGGVPSIGDDERIKVTELGQGFYRMVASFGFMETPNVPKVMEFAFESGFIPKVMPLTYYLGRETLIPVSGGRMMRWRKRLFAYLSRNSRSASSYFRLPPDQVIELGVQIEL